MFGQIAQSGGWTVTTVGVFLKDGSQNIRASCPGSAARVESLMAQWVSSRFQSRLWSGAQRCVASGPRRLFTTSSERENCMFVFGDIKSIDFFACSCHG